MNIRMVKKSDSTEFGSVVVDGARWTCLNPLGLPLDQWCQTLSQSHHHYGYHQQPVILYFLS